MSEVANLYDNGPISPVARINDNISVWSEQKWLHYKIEYIEPTPRSSPFVAELITISGATQLAANGTITQQAIAVLVMNDLELLHLRWEPLDDVEGVLWELANQARFQPRGAQARVTRFTSMRDPYLATTTFWILGKDKDIRLGCFNPNPVLIILARFAFWGYRYILQKLTSVPVNTVYLPASGR